jgi:acyl-CoA reductase-like NAD-dependent aldehyde dehydrogenase
MSSWGAKMTAPTSTEPSLPGLAAERLIPCYLELGGKDPMIVCADADLERAAPDAGRGRSR